MSEVKVEMNGDENEKAMGDSKSLAEPTTEKIEYDQLCTMVNKIAHPLASRKLAKKIYKLIKKASQEKNYLRQGIKDVHKAIRRNEKGIVILAGDVSPLDIYSHMPALCEAKDLLYVFTPSRKHLGLATGHKRSVILLLLRKHENYAALYDTVAELVNTLSPDS